MSALGQPQDSQRQARLMEGPVFRGILQGLTTSNGPQAASMGLTQPALQCLYPHPTSQPTKG
eukprot:1656451-Amphidinium_carterae.1